MVRREKSVGKFSQCDATRKIGSVSEKEFTDSGVYVACQAYELVARSFLEWSIPVDRLCEETLKSTDQWSRLIQKEVSASL